MHIPHPVHPQWNAHSHHIKAMFGLSHKAKWPQAGIEPRFLHGVKVWVNPLNPNRKSAREHRVMCECPKCGKQMSLGRLHQHVC